MTTLDYALITIYMFLILFIGIMAGKGLNSLKEYAVAKQSYGTFVLTATLSASFIGGGFSFGNADTVFNQGLMAATALWGFSLMLILVALFIAPHVGSFRDCISTGDILQRRFGKSVRILAGVLGAIVCTGILAAQIGAIGAIFTQFTPLSFFEGVLIGCGVVIIYTAVGGMKAVVLTDVIQFILLVVCIPLALVLGIAYVGGVNEIIAHAPLRFFEMPQGSAAWGVWLGLFLSFVIGETLVPPYVQRLLIAKSVKITVRGTFFSGLLSIPFFLITGAIGLIAFVINPEISSNLAMPMVVETVLPMGIKGIAAAAIISIVLSSADSFLNAASVCLVEDVIRPLAGKDNNLTSKEELVLIQFLTLLVGIGAVFIALSISNVLEILKFAYNFWAPVMLVPLICVLRHKKVCNQAFWSAATVGSATIIGLFVFCGGKCFHLDGFVIATILSGLTFFVVNHFYGKKEGAV